MDMCYIIRFNIYFFFLDFFNLYYEIVLLRYQSSVAIYYYYCYVVMHLVFLFMKKCARNQKQCFNINYYFNSMISNILITLFCLQYVQSFTKRKFIKIRTLVIQ
jgi:hypothetical protein